MQGSTSTTGARSRRSVAVPAAALGVVIVLLGVALALNPPWSTGAGTEPTTESTSTAESDDPSADEARQVLMDLPRRDPEDPLAMGEVDAPVVLVSYSDFQCPFCGKFARDTEPELVERFVDTGVLRIEWRDFPYFGPDSELAAAAARAAGEQGKFWEFHDAVYALDLPPKSGQLTREKLLELAGGLDLDLDRFETTMNDPATAQAVATDFTEGQQLGVTGTPTFVLNGQPVVGAQPLETFVAAIEAAQDESR